MAKKQKFYVVWKGHNPGIYTSWDDTLAQTKGYPDAKYKSYKSKEEAEAAFRADYRKEFSYNKAQNKQATSPLSLSQVVKNSISVDAACSGNPGLMEYQGVKTVDKSPIFHAGPFEEGTNNVGEFLALVHALALLKKLGKEDVSIYTDSRTAMAWVRKKNPNTKLTRTKKNEKLFELMERAVVWLKSNDHKNPILKWDTENWGEIPADFGRK